MQFPSKDEVARVRTAYPVGSRVALVSMSDPYTNLKSGETGTVDHVDDTGTVFINWDCGSSLGAVYGEDTIRRIPRISDKVVEQILKVRDTGETNMFDIKAVFEIAMREDYHELADFIFMDTKAYTNFILTGETL